MKEDTELKETTNEDKELKVTSRRQITKAAVIAAVAAPIAALLASCTQQPSQGEGATPSPSPSGTPKREGGDSPIIVGGGGSVSIDFDDTNTYLVDNAANPTKYEGAIRINRMIIMNRKAEVTQNLSFTSTDCHVAFDVRDDMNAPKPIGIDSTGGQTTITFNKDHYLRDGHRFFHHQRKMKTITINGATQGVDDKGTIILL